MAEIKANEIIEADKLTADLQKIIDKMNELLGVMSKNSAAFQKAGTSTKQLTEAEKEAAENKKKQIAAEKELAIEQKKAAALKQKEIAALEKQEAKQKELIASATKVVKTLGDLNAKLAAQRTLIKGLEFGSDAYNEMAASISELAKQQDIANSSLGVFNQRVGNYQKAADSVNMSLGEMKKELRELRNMSFANLKPEEITQIRDRMAELTDQIGDFQSQIRTASADRIPALVDGLQGIIAVAQGVTGTLAIFGVETEKLDKAMVQLIGVSQALKTIQELQEKGTIKVAVATAKDTAAKIANAVAAKGQAMATTGATVATRLLGKAMQSNPYLLLIAGAVALAAGLYVLISRMTATANSAKIMRKANEEASQSFGKQKAELESLMVIAKDTNISMEKRKEAIIEINKISPEYLGNITLENIGTAESTKLIDDYVKMLDKKARAMAYNNLLAEQYTKLSMEEIKTWENLTEVEKLYYQTQAAAAGLAGSGKLFFETEKAKNTMAIYEQVNAIKELIAANGELNATGGGTSGGGNDNTTLTAYQKYLQAVDRLNAEYQLSIKLNATQENQITSLITLNQGLFDVFKDYSAEGGWSQQETEKLIELQTETKKAEKALLELQENALKKLSPTQLKEITTTTQEVKTSLVDVVSFITNNPIDFTKLAKTPKDERTPFEIMQYEAEKFLGYYEKYAQGITELSSAISSAITTMYDRQIEAQQKAADKNAEYYDNLLKNYDTDSAEYQQFLFKKQTKQERYQNKLVQLEIKKAKFDKAKAITDIAITTATGIIKAIVEENYYLAAAIGAAGAVQTGIVASQPLPQYRIGLKDAKEDHFGIVGDAGPEAVNYPDGSTALFTKPTVAFLPQHTSVDTAAETAARLRKGDYNLNLRQLNDTNKEQVKYLSIIARNTTGNRSSSVKDTMYINKYLK